MATLIQIRRDTEANWTTNDPILASGEIAFSTDQYKIKIGDGTSNWSSLAYMTATPTEITNQINAAISGLIDSAPGTLDTLNELAAALNDDPDFFNTVATNLSNHESDTTNVHGIADTSLLATTSYVDTAEADAIASANSYSDGLAVNYDASGSAAAVASDLTDHENTTTNVHGIADTSLLATTSYVDTAESDAVTTANSYSDSLAVNYDPAGSAATAESNANSYADSTFVPLTQKAAANGVATLDGNSKIPSSQLPSIAIVDTHVVNSEAAMLALTVEQGDIAVRTDLNKTFILSGTDPSVFGNWQELLTPTDAVQSVDGRTGTVSLSDLYDASGSAATAQSNAESYADSLASNYDPAGSASAAQTAAESYADSLAVNYDAAGSASTAESNANSYTDSSISTHNSDTTNVHGIADTSLLATTSYVDTAESDAVASANSYSDSLAVNYDSAGSAATAESNANSYTDSAITTHSNVTTSVHGISDTANLVYTNDSRLSDSRTPTAHASSHESGGTDELTLAQSQITNLTTDLAAKAPIDSPTLTGTPAAPTAAAGTNSTQIATTSFVQTAVSNLVDSAPTTLDTLNELAAALNDDPNFATTVTNSIADKQPLDADLTAIAALAGTNGFLKKTAEDTWALDTNTYLTGNQTITLTGDVSGSGTTSISVTVADDSHNHIISNVDGLQDALDLKAPLASPTLTGTPAAPTAAVDTNTTQIATTAYVVGQGYLKSSSYTASDVLTKIKTVDGSASGLDADLLDGQEGSYYLDWTNTTNKPDPTITLGGDASGSLTLTDLAGGTLTVTIADDSHNHIISNIDGLQTALDAKAPLASPSFTGSITLDSKANVDTTSTTVSANTATTIDTLSASSYRSAEYLVQVTQGTKQTVSKIIMIHDGTTANISEYGVIELGGTRIPLTLSATISGTDVLLQATITDASSTNATVEVVRTAIVL